MLEWMTFHNLAQFQILVVGIASITLITHNPRLAILGFWLGLSNQWCWYYESLSNAQWGAFFINIAYGVNYIRGIRRYKRFARDV